MKTKKCSSCQVVKPVEEFHKNKAQKDGRRHHCKSCRSKENQDLWKTEEYRKCQRGYAMHWRKKYPINHRYSTLLRRKTPVEFSLDEFKEWWAKQLPVCSYCRQELINGAGTNQRGKEVVSNMLSIERKDNSKPYTLDNIAFACYRCNQIKGRWLTEREMKKVAKLLWG